MEVRLLSHNPWGTRGHQTACEPSLLKCNEGRRVFPLLEASLFRIPWERLPKPGGLLVVPLAASHLPLSRWTVLSCWPSLAGWLRL